MKGKKKKKKTEVGLARLVASGPRRLWLKKVANLSNKIMVTD